MIPEPPPSPILKPQEPRPSQPSSLAPLKLNTSSLPQRPFHKSNGSADPLRSHPTTPTPDGQINGTSPYGGRPNGFPSSDYLSSQPRSQSPALTPKSTAYAAASSSFPASPSPSPATGQRSNSPLVSGGQGTPPPLENRKRPHGVRKLMSFRSLSAAFSSQHSSRHDVNGNGSSASGRETPSLFGGRSSSGTFTGRPDTPGGTSTTSTAESAGGGGARPSLKKRVSRTFWGRRNSLMVSNLDEFVPSAPYAGQSEGGQLLVGEEGAGAQVVDGAGEGANGHVGEHGRGHGRGYGNGYDGGERMEGVLQTTSSDGGAEGRASIPERSENRTPPPQLPDLGSLARHQGLKEKNGDFLVAETMFDSIH